MMDEIITILKNLHPDVDFETCDTLIDDGILDSFDIGAEHIVPENFNSAGALWELVCRLEDED